MNGIKTHHRASMPKGMYLFATIFAALTLAVVLAFAGSLQTSSQAYANIYPASEAAAMADQASGQAASTDAAASGQTAETDDREKAEGETIEENETPMSSGLGGGEPLASSDNGLKWVIIVGIVAVVAFFAFSTVRLNNSIKSMRSRFKR